VNEVSRKSLPPLLCVSFEEKKVGEKLIAEIDE
jgi:hypothetical protein